MMKNLKHTLLLPLAGLMCLSLGTCVSAGETVEDITEAVTESAATAVDEIDWNVFFVQNPEEYVTLGEYHGLEVTKSVYTITDEDVEIEIDNRMYAEAAMEDVDRPAQLGDTVTADIVSTVNGESYVDEEYPIDLGFEQFGPEFDEQLTGCAAGDQLSFSIAYEEGYEVEEWAGQTVDFDVDVLKVQVLNQPEFSEEWVRENTEYEDAESYKAALRKSLQEQSDWQSQDSAASSAFQAAMENAEFNGYPQDLYDAVYAQVYSQFEMLSDMFGISMEELFESYEMEESDLQDETLEQVHSYLFLSALAKAEGITAGDEDLKAFADEMYEAYGYESADAMLEEGDRGELTLSALNRKVCYYLLDQSTVTEVDAAYAEDDLILEDSSAVDEWEDEEWEGDEFAWEYDTEMDDAAGE